MCTLRRPVVTYCSARDSDDGVILTEKLNKPSLNRRDSTGMQIPGNVLRVREISFMPCGSHSGIQVRSTVSTDGVVSNGGNPSLNNGRNVSRISSLTTSDVTRNCSIRSPLRSYKSIRRDIKLYAVAITCPIPGNNTHAFTQAIGDPYSSCRRNEIIERGQRLIIGINQAGERIDDVIAGKRERF